MNPGPYVKSLVPAILAVLYSLQSWVLTGHVDLVHVRASVFGLVLAALVWWFPNTPKVTTGATTTVVLSEDPQVTAARVADVVKRAAHRERASAPSWPGV